jgi:hypothetical protein
MQAETWSLSSRSGKIISMDWFTTSQAAKQMHVSPETLRRWHRENRIDPTALRRGRRGMLWSAGWVNNQSSLATPPDRIDGIVYVSSQTRQFRRAALLLVGLHVVVAMLAFVLELLFMSSVGVETHVAKAAIAISGSFLLLGIAGWSRMTVHAIDDGHWGSLGRILQAWWFRLFVSGMVSVALALVGYARVNPSVSGDWVSGTLMATTMILLPPVWWACSRLDGVASRVMECAKFEQLAFNSMRDDAWILDAIAGMRIAYDDKSKL